MKQWNLGTARSSRPPTASITCFAAAWNQSGGHGAWYGSVAVHATSSNLYGPYTDQGLCWPDWNHGSGHNVSALHLKDGRYAIVESGIRPGVSLFLDSLNGPWSYLGNVQAGFCTQSLQIMLRPDGHYESIISDTTIGIADNVAGPHVAQGSILKETGMSQPIWKTRACRSAVTFLSRHYQQLKPRKAYHFTFLDGIHNWRLQPGYPYDPTADFLRYADGAVIHWNKAERPSVLY